MELNARAQTTRERQIFLEVIQAMLLNGALTMGQALRVLRATHLGVTRRAYARMVKVSNSTLADLENDTGNPTLKSVQRAFRPFGLVLGLLPRQRASVALARPDVAADLFEEVSARILDVVG